MGRAPWSERLAIKKGPWSEEEDRILTSFIQKNGHGNWRSLPKRAGLLRCGKSCRLRWVNYLKPDIKRGNFTKEEEDTIIGLHQMLGNRWSAIAAELPGRTDNEIKNVWHSHLKKRLQHSSSSLSETSNGSSSSNGSCRSTSITTTDVEPQIYGDLALEVFSPSEQSIIQEVEESIWSEEFTVPFLENPIQHVEDDLNFWMDMSIDGHFRYF